MSDVVGAARRRAGLLVPAAVTIVGALVRVWRLDHPSTYVFDEAYYVPDALAFLDGRFDRPSAHPPLGKWLVAAGIRLLGNDPWGWRIMSLLAGSAIVLLTYMLAVRLFGSWRWASLAAAFVAVDGLQIVQSRVAMLDIFLSLFVVAGALAAYAYGARPAEQRGGDRRTSPAWLAAAGAAFGCALAVKWSAAPVLVLAATAIVVTADDRRRELRLVGTFLVLLPAAVYLLSYTGEWVAGLDVREWVEMQRSMLTFHASDLPRHPYASSSIGWLLLRRPVAYSHSTTSAGEVEHILAVGNPILWWTFLATIPWLVRAWLGRRDRVADVVMLGLVATYVPWLVVQRTSFLYYLTPLVPFMAIGVAWALRRLWRSSLSPVLRKGAVVAGVGAVFAAAAILAPIWLGVPVGQEHWHRLMVFDSWR